MNTRLFDVFEDTSDNRLFAVTDGIDIYLYGILEKFVDQYWVLEICTAYGCHEIFYALNRALGISANGSKPVGKILHQRQNTTQRVRGQSLPARCTRSLEGCG